MNRSPATRATRSHRRRAPLRRRAVAWIGVLGLGLGVLAGCEADPLTRSQQVAAGSADRGRELLTEYGCTSCHNVPGVDAAEPAWIGPPLDHWGLRSYIAGSLVNNQDNLVLWITAPQEVEPGTAMPDVGVSVAEAENIAAYLLSLE